MLQENLRFYETDSSFILDKNLVATLALISKVHMADTGIVKVKDIALK